MTAGRLTGIDAASALALPSPRAASRSSTCRRVGSARAANSSPCSAAAATSGRHRDGVLLELGELHLPALGVALEVLASLLVRAVEHSEAALDDAQAGALALGAEGELDQRGVAVGRLHT